MKRFKRRELFFRQEPAGSGWKRATRLPAPTVARTASVLKPWEPAARAGGALRQLGGSAWNEIEFVCADGAVTFRLRAVHTGG